MDARIDLVPRWRGGDLDRLIDARHAGMVETLVRRLASLPDWIAQPEVTFSIYGEHGSIDLVAWHPGRRAFLTAIDGSRETSLGIGIGRQRSWAYGS